MLFLPMIPANDFQFLCVYKINKKNAKKEYQ